MLAKENLEITSECSYRLPNQAAAVKKQVHISVSWLFSFSITVCQDLTHDFWVLPRPALPTMSSEKFWWFTTRKVGTQGCDAEPFSAVSRSGLLCVSAEPCPCAHPFLSKPSLSLKDSCGAQQSSTGAKVRLSPAPQRNPWEFLPLAYSQRQGLAQNTYQGNKFSRNMNSLCLIPKHS